MSVAALLAGPAGGLITSGLGALGGAGLSMGGNIIGANMSHRKSKKMAREVMRFQERMANTQYQRAMTDMRAAGLNPILAYKMGGAAAPTGQMAQAPDLSGLGEGAVSGARSLGMLSAQRRLVQQQYDESWARTQAGLALEYKDRMQGNLLLQDQQVRDIQKQEAQMRLNLIRRHPNLYMMNVFGPASGVVGSTARGIGSALMPFKRPTQIHRTYQYYKRFMK